MEATYKTNIVKVPELMYQQEKGSQLREDYGLTTLNLFKENRLVPMTALVVKHIMDEI